ncbi:MAG TPA: tRNA (N(6)-L-threonylcarbamoyladenosine(37)-C(2))-methylthiotransferase MtaB [Candidatus Copromonas faecavium]|uniref:Threonylcarbamoyladenosine tRNA methylthiotransferase MtaB n=1 Tax=Candidatus Copromonas faecavium (nom. illeg.) TaxID=2840740 RepID=A0A9D1D681_9FIRM|nr:tRNA (N(6)-L-threonylcarbamoyladenosine(37)-C(2))-methylthiotransferase MtaB [Candidatus Copromonas faecavium]
MRRAALHNLGCKVNSYETEAMKELLQAAGYEIVDFEDKADVYVINTCSVTNVADKKSRQMLHRARTRNPQAVVVAAGCYVQAAGEKLKEDGAVDLIVGNNKKTELVPLLEEYFAGREHPDGVIDISAVQEYEPLHITAQTEHTRAFIKVQDGCNQFCSYCIIPYTRGRIRSRRMEDVEEEVRGLAKKGYQEVVLTGIHLSSYGLDFKDGTDLLALIRRIHQVDGIKRIRFGSLEPRIITDEFAKALSELPKVCPHFHLSLQSGCDDVLKRMNRHYTCEEYEERCQILRRYFEQPAITTDVIVGFPGETDEEFRQTKEFLKTIRFYEMHVFKYSRRAGTRADRMPDQVPEPVKTERSAELLSLEAEMSREYRSTFLGKTEEILLEEPVEINGQRYMIGHTKEYVKGAVLLGKREPEDLKNTFVSGILKNFLTDEIIFLAESGKVG